MLNAKQQIAVQLYTSDPTCSNLESALLKAGYGAARVKITCSELRRNPDFLRAVERATVRRIEKLEKGPLTDEQVVDTIREIDEECKQAGAVATFLSLRLKCAELLCKIRGMFIERVELGLDEALIQRLEAGRKRAGLPPATEPPLAELPSATPPSAEVQ